MERANAGTVVENLFRRESAHLVSALVRLLGRSNVALAEDVVHDALISAMHAWRFGVPENPKKTVENYDALLALSPGPVVAMSRGLAIAELRGLDAGRAALVSLEDDPKLAGYSFYWAARADIERRSGRAPEAVALYQRAATLAKSGAERRSYERRLRQLEN